jgi:hypothetical protein
VLLGGLLLLNAGGGVNWMAGFRRHEDRRLGRRGGVTKLACREIAGAAWVGEVDRAVYHGHIQPRREAGGLGGSGMVGVLTCASAAVEPSAASKARQLEVNFFMGFPAMWLSEKLLRR